MTVAAQVQSTWPRMRELPLVLRLEPAVHLSDDELLALCALNRELRIERTAEGDLLLMPPTGGGTSNRNSEINRQLGNWARRDGSGMPFDSSGGFKLPNGAMRSPDAAWMPRSRLEQFSAAQIERFIPACPDFVLELCSPTDTMADLHAKLREYLANGARLGLLLDPETRRVFVYRPDAPVEQLDDPATVAGDPVLPGFILDLREVW